MEGSLYRKRMLIEVTMMMMMMMLIEVTMMMMMMMMMLIEVPMMMMMIGVETMLIRTNDCDNNLR